MTVEQKSVDGVVAEDAPHGRLTLRDHLALNVLWFSLNFQSAALVPILIPTQILLFVSPGTVGNVAQASFMGWLAAGGTFIVVIVPPLFGALSDHTRGRFGRRRPYIALGGLFLLGGAAELATAHGLAAFIAGGALFQFGAGICSAGYESLVPDRVPSDQRGAASGFIGLMSILGNVGSLGVALLLLASVNSDNIDPTVIRNGAAAYYGITGVVLALGIVATLVGVHEVPLEQLQRDRPVLARRSWRDRIIGPWITPWRQPNFLWVFLTRMLVILGMTLFMVYIEYYFANVVGATNFVQATIVVVILTLGGAVLSALIFGIASDRLGRVPLVIISALFMAVPALAFVVAPGRLPLWPFGIVFGLGYGAYSSVDWALAVDSLPDQFSAGKDMGLWSMASNLPAIIAPLIGAVIIELAVPRITLADAYRLIFLVAAIALVLGGVCVMFVRSVPRKALGYEQANN